VSYPPRISVVKSVGVGVWFSAGVIINYVVSGWCSPYKRALRQMKSKEYRDIIKLCTEEINMTLSTHMSEALLLRATFYLLRGEMNCAMEDFEQLLAMDGVDKHVSVFTFQYFSI